MLAFELVNVVRRPEKRNILVNTIFRIFLEIERAMAIEHDHSAVIIERIGQKKDIGSELQLIVGVSAAGFDIENHMPARAHTSDPVDGSSIFPLGMVASDFDALHIRSKSMLFSECPPGFEIGAKFRLQR